MIMAILEDISDIVNKAIDHAFIDEKYQLNFYNYLQGEQCKRSVVLQFINSSLGLALVNQIEEIDLYLEGGDKAAFFRESYGWMGKPRARKVRDYLNKILEDADKYERSKRPGRKPGSKNKKESATTTK
jgi:hypothetical protein